MWESQVGSWHQSACWIFWRARHCHVERLWEIVLTLIWCRARHRSRRYYSIGHSIHFLSCCLNSLSLWKDTWPVLRRRLVKFIGKLRISSWSLSGLHKTFIRRDLIRLSLFPVLKKSTIRNYGPINSILLFLLISNHWSIQELCCKTISTFKYFQISLKV